MNIRTITIILLMISGLFRKIQAGGLRTYFKKKKKTASSRFVTLTLEILDKKSFLVLYSLENLRPKIKINVIFSWSHKVRFYFYLWKFWTKQILTIGNSVKLFHILWSPWEIALLFQLTPRVSNMIFLQYPRKFHALNPSILYNS